MNPSTLQWDSPQNVQLVAQRKKPSCDPNSSRIPVDTHFAAQKGLRLDQKGRKRPKIAPSGTQLLQYHTWLSPAYLVMLVTCKCTIFGEGRLGLGLLHPTWALRAIWALLGHLEPNRRQYLRSHSPQMGTIPHDTTFGGCNPEWLRQAF